MHEFSLNILSGELTNFLTALCALVRTVNCHFNAHTEEYCILTSFKRIYTNETSIKMSIIKIYDDSLPVCLIFMLDIFFLLHSHAKNA